MTARTPYGISGRTLNDRCAHYCCWADSTHRSYRQPSGITKLQRSQQHGRWLLWHDWDGSDPQSSSVAGRESLYQPRPVNSWMSSRMPAAPLPNVKMCCYSSSSGSNIIIVQDGPAMQLLSPSSSTQVHPSQRIPTCANLSSCMHCCLRKHCRPSQARHGTTC